MTTPPHPTVAGTSEREIAGFRKKMYFVVISINGRSPVSLDYSTCAALLRGGLRGAAAGDATRGGGRGGFDCACRCLSGLLSSRVPEARVVLTSRVSWPPVFFFFSRGGRERAGGEFRRLRDPRWGAAAPLARGGGGHWRIFRTRVTARSPHLTSPHDDACIVHGYMKQPTCGRWSGASRWG